MIRRWRLYFPLPCRSDIMLTDTFRAIGRREEAFFATVDNAAATGAAYVEDMRDGRAVDSLRALFRVVEERVWRHAPATALEGDIRVETLKSFRAIVNTTYPLAKTTSRLRIIVGEYSMAARFNFRTQALIRMRGGSTTSVAERATHAITEAMRRWTDALLPLCDERRFAVERAGVLGGTSGRRVIGI